MPKPFLALFLFAAACAPGAADRPAASPTAGERAMLVESVPGEGATVRAPRVLSLTFREPVRLVELVVSGPAGEMPVMVEAAGERTSYSIPMSDPQPGRYTVRWRALAQGGEPHEGRFGFTVR